MLKAQLHSKMSRLVKMSPQDTDWMNIEDILTGDFFGTLDYLPRDPFVKDFIDYVVSLNPKIKRPENEEVDWENIKINFWPRSFFTEEENAEPDVVIVSNRWVLVIEVKLMSGLGNSQPWREYIVGRKIAEEHAVSPDSVYYLVVARNRLDIAHTFTQKERVQLEKMLPKTFYLKWHEALSLVDSWLRRENHVHNSSSGIYRLLSDLYQAARRRPVLVFSDFAFENTNFVNLVSSRIFCPPRFTGFLKNSLALISQSKFVFFCNAFDGFGNYFVAVPSCNPYKSIFLKDIEQ